MSGAVIVLNAGSSSINFAAFACDASSFELSGRLLHGEIDGIVPAARLVARNAYGASESAQDQERALKRLFEWLELQVDDRSVLAVGIDEHSAAVRARVGATAAWLGVAIDDKANGTNAHRFDGASSRVAVHIIPTDEEPMLARHVHEQLAEASVR